MSLRTDPFPSVPFSGRIARFVTIVTQLHDAPQDPSMGWGILGRPNNAPFILSTLLNGPHYGPINKLKLMWRLGFDCLACLWKSRPLCASTISHNYEGKNVPEDPFKGARGKTFTSLPRIRIPLGATILSALKSTRRSALTFICRCKAVRTSCFDTALIRRCNKPYVIESSRRLRNERRTDCKIIASGSGSSHATINRFSSRLSLSLSFILSFTIFTF